MFEFVEQGELGIVGIVHFHVIGVVEVILEAFVFHEQDFMDVGQGLLTGPGLLELFAFVGK